MFKQQSVNIVIFEKLHNIRYHRTDLFSIGNCLRRQCFSILHHHSPEAPIFISLRCTAATPSTENDGSYPSRSPRYHFESNF